MSNYKFNEYTNNPHYDLDLLKWDFSIEISGNPSRNRKNSVEIQNFANSVSCSKFRYFRPFSVITVNHWPYCKSNPDAKGCGTSGSLCPFQPKLPPQNPPSKQQLSIFLTNTYLAKSLFDYILLSAVCGLTPLNIIHTYTYVRLALQC